MAADLLGRILVDLPIGRGEEVAVLVNGLGATPLMELYVLFRQAGCLLAEQGIRICRWSVGEYVTVLDMVGASLTLLRLDDGLRRLVDAPCGSPSFVQA